MYPPFHLSTTPLVFVKFCFVYMSVCTCTFSTWCICDFSPFTLSTGGPDTVNPVFVNCPSDIVQTLPTGQTSTTVTWTEPTATDNVTPVGQIGIFATQRPGSTFAVGIRTVTYIARDQAGNEATCTFNVIVQSELYFAFILLVRCLCKLVFLFLFC